jgi:mycothiol synthase
MTSIALHDRTLHDDDIPPIVELFNAHEAAGGRDDWMSPDELRHELSHPNIDRARDVRVWEDGEGLLAYAYLFFQEGDEPDVFLRFLMRLDATDGAAERLIYDWARQRSAEVCAQRGVDYRLRCGAFEGELRRIALLKSWDLRPLRYFQRLRHVLHMPIAAPQLPSGYRLRTFEGEADVEPWVELFNQSFVDHWNHHELTPEALRHYLASPEYRADLDLLAIAPDGSFAGFCYCVLKPAGRSGKHYDEGFIGVLGTRRGHRGIGLGRALLLAGLHLLKQQGAAVVDLSVDTQNPSGAGRLYASVGFEPLRTFMLFSQK